MNEAAHNLFLESVDLIQQGRGEEAEIKLQKIISADSSADAAFNALGIIYAGREDFWKAKMYFKNALTLVPESSLYNSNYANSLQDTNSIEDSFEFYLKAIQLESQNFDAYCNLGNAYRKCQRFPEAINSYETLIKLNPHYIKAYVNLASVYEALKQFDQVIGVLNAALRIDPYSLEALTALAVAYTTLKNYDAAIDFFKKAYATGKANDKFFINYGSACQEMQNPSDAAQAFLKAAELAPSKHAALGRALHQKMMVADWSGVKEINDEIVRRLKLNQDVAEPFGYMGYSDSEQDLQITAQIYLHKKYPSLLNHSPLRKYPRHAKIKIAYVSAEFREHANGLLMTGLIECHDRQKFEVIGLDNGDGDDSDLRRRLVASFDELIDIRNISDFDLTQIIQAKEIDILVNLNGFFGGHRTCIFSNRAAPIQINFLGCPGTMGADYMDYLIADSVVIPKASYQFYNEKIISLPNSYQVNDSKRAELKGAMTRQGCGLPEEAFVFCCFNNIYKITPETFKRWMKVLQRVPNSVMWFYYNFIESTENLKREAQAMGVEPSRLIFSPSMKMADHIQRTKLADLFLDSLPYNAHTTASDALWANVPVLTLQGKSFAGRVAASLLHAIEMPELITYTEQEFEDRAVDLATHPEKLTALKAKLAKNRLTTPLFDTQLYTKHFESALVQAYELYQSDLPPAHIEVKP